MANMEIKQSIKIGRKYFNVPPLEEFSDGSVFRLRAAYSPAFPS
jgi:hypothetical protein